jgi:hypothetical protein
VAAAEWEPLVRERVVGGPLGAVVGTAEKTEKDD